MWQFLLKAISKEVEDKKVCEKSYHGFSMANSIAFCDQLCHPSMINISDNLH